MLTFLQTLPAAEFLGYVSVARDSRENGPSNK